MPVPAGLDWDFWQGQTRKVDFVTQRCHVNFRFWYEYSGGTMTDWGAHHNDIAAWATGLVAPREIQGRAKSKPVAGGYSAIADYDVRYTYENGVRLRVRTTKTDNIFGERVKPGGRRNGLRFEGTGGWIWVNRSEIKASDPGLLRTPLPENAERLQVSTDHMENFFACVRSRRLPICDVETGHRSASICHLGAIALRTGRKLTWDHQAERFTGEHAAEANGYLAREMRAPYDYSFSG